MPEKLQFHRGGGPGLRDKPGPLRKAEKTETNLERLLWGHKVSKVSIKLGCKLST